MELEEVAAPGAPEGSVVGDRAFDDVDHMLGAAGGEGADGCLLDEGDVAFFLAGDDVVHDKRNLGGDGFLNGRAAGFADEQVVRAHEGGHLIGPTDEFAASGQTGAGDGGAGVLAAAGDDGGVEIVDFGKHLEGADRAFVWAAGEENDTPLAIAGRWGREEFVELQADGKAERVDAGVVHAIASEDLGGGFVRDDGSVAGVAIPSLVDHRGVGDDRVKWLPHRRLGRLDFFHHIAEHWIGRGHEVGLEFVQEAVDRIDELLEQRGHSLDDLRAAEQGEDGFPEAGIVVDRRRVAALDEAVHDRVRAGVGIDDKRFDAVRRLEGEGVFDITRGGVVALAHAGGEDEDSDGAMAAGAHKWEMVAKFVGESSLTRRGFGAGADRAVSEFGFQKLGGEGVGGVAEDAALGIHRDRVATGEGGVWIQGFEQRGASG